MREVGPAEGRPGKQEELAGAINSLVNVKMLKKKTKTKTKKKKQDDKEAVADR